MSWVDRVDELLYDGETRIQQYDLEDASIVITSHRVLVFTPTTDGSEYRHVDRPNIGAVKTKTDGNYAAVAYAAGAGILATVLLGVASQFQFRSLSPSLDTGTETDGGDVSDVFGIVDGLFALVDLFVLGAGVLAAIVAVVFAGLYLSSRERRLVLDVRGDDSIAIPITGREGELASELEDAVWSATDSTVDG